MLKEGRHVLGLQRAAVFDERFTKEKDGEVGRHKVADVIIHRSMGNVDPGKDT